MVNSFLNKFLSKRVCVDTHNHCSFKEPYSELQFLNKNEATGRNFSEEEIEEKTKQYENMCKLGRENYNKHFSESVYKKHMNKVFTEVIS